MFIAPRNYRYDSTATIIGSQILWLSRFGHQHFVAHGVSIHPIQHRRIVDIDQERLSASVRSDPSPKSQKTLC
jgi:hypothetical protein